MAGNAYNPRLVFLLFDSIRIQGAGPDSFVEFAPQSSSETQIGVDGHASVSIASSEAQLATISLAVTSEGYKQMAAFVSEDRRAGGLGSIPRTFSYSDGLGHRVTEQCAVIVDAPIPGAGRTSAVVSFQVFLPNPNIDYPPPTV